MALTAKEIESQLTQRRLDDLGLQAKYTQLLASFNQLQADFNTSRDQLNSVTGTVGQLSGSGLDTYSDAGGILHRLKTRFIALVTFSASFIISGLTTSRPLKLDSTGTAIADKIDLAAPTTDIKNTLGLANGGTNGTTAATARTSLNAGNAALYTCSITTPLTGTISGTADLVTGAVTGTCTITAGVIKVTITV